MKFDQSAIGNDQQQELFQDMRDLMDKVYHAQGKMLLSSDGTIIYTDGADSAAGVTRIQVSLVGLVRQAEGQFWDKELYEDRIENVRVGIRAVVLSAVLQDHPVSSRNELAFINAVETQKRLLMSQRSISIAGKGMREMIGKELISSRNIIAGIKAGTLSRADAASELMQLPQRKERPQYSLKYELEVLET